jgi:A/G-specific adenine glycosylase
VVSNGPHAEVVCVPKNPLCAVCPLAAHCIALRTNATEQLPVKSKARARRIELRCILVCRCGDTVALRKREPKGLLAGLWELPNACGTWETCAAQIGVLPEHIARLEPLAPAKHIFTHIEWQMTGIRLTLHQKPENPTLIWATEAELRARYTLPSAFAPYRVCCFVEDSSQ